MISVVIPAYNEAPHIRKTIRTLRKHDEQRLIREIIIADGGSTDDTIRYAKEENAIPLSCPQKGRAVQMNHGARQATADILYFLHADTLPPEGFARDIINAVHAGFQAGCFTLSFDHPHWFLKANCWFTRFDVNAFRYGDQSLFVTRDTFLKSGGFCTAHIVMEDYNLIKRLRKTSRFTIIRKPVLTSSRKYTENGFFKTQAAFYLIFLMYACGFSQQKLVLTYRKLIKQDKL